MEGGNLRGQNETRMIRCSVFRLGCRSLVVKQNRGAALQCCTDAVIQVQSDLKHHFVKSALGLSLINVTTAPLCPGNSLRAAHATCQNLAKERSSGEAGAQVTCALPPNV